MEIRQLEYFLMVRKLQSFTRAAERLYISQPAITNAIRSLEAELGVVLFDRSQKQAILTAEGRIFEKHVEQIMSGISSTINEINALKTMSAGNLVVGLTPLGGIKEPLQLIKGFSDKFPDITIRFKEGNTDALVELLLEDKIDVAFLTEDGNPLLSYFPLTTEELLVCCSTDHMLRRRNSVKPEELEGDRLLLPASDCSYRQMIIDMFEACNTLPEIRYETQHIQTLKSLVAVGCGITILPESICMSSNDLSIMPLNPPLLMRPFLSYKTNKQHSKAAEGFIEFVKGVCKE